MTDLLSRPPYERRDEPALLRELNTLTRHHLAGCEAYRRIWPSWTDAASFEDLPWLHVGLFKHITFRTLYSGVRHERILKSSATTSGSPSQIVLDQESSEQQSRSTFAILRDFIGPDLRPLLILDSAKSLRVRGEVSARVAAALSLKPFAAEICFLLDDASDVSIQRWDALLDALDRYDDLLVYGFTWILWLAWACAVFPDSVRDKLRGKRIMFVHSGGWKKLEAMKVDRAAFDQALLDNLHPESKVVDYYGLVEQIGVVYPLCEFGLRHIPLWAAVIVRDSYTLKPLSSETGQLQLINSLPLGAPYHSVLTEDLGRIEPGPCPCGRSGPGFVLQGRVPNAELRGCANV